MSKEEDDKERERNRKAIEALEAQKKALEEKLERERAKRSN